MFVAFGMIEISMLLMIKNHTVADALRPSVCVKSSSTTKPVSAGVVAKE